MNDPRRDDQGHPEPPELNADGDEEPPEPVDDRTGPEHDENDYPQRRKDAPL